MIITVLFFGITTDLTGKNSLLYEIKESSTIHDLKKSLMTDYPSLKNMNEFAIALNEEYATDVEVIKNGDIIAIIPPVSGG